MREFKFRAWENNKMYYQVRCGGVFDGIPTAPTVWNEEASDWLNLTGQPHTKIMQCTSFKDVNGYEVYEGDIVKVKWLKDTDKGVVRWFACGFYVMDMEWHTSIPLSSMSARIEVLGNVFENEVDKNGVRDE